MNTLFESKRKIKSTVIISCLIIILTILIFTIFTIKAGTFVDEAAMLLGFFVLLIIRLGVKNIKPKVYLYSGRLYLIKKSGSIDMNYRSILNIESALDKEGALESFIINNDKGEIVEIPVAILGGLSECRKFLNTIVINKKGPILLDVTCEDIVNTRTNKDMTTRKPISLKAMRLIILLVSVDLILVAYIVLSAILADNIN